RGNRCRRADRHGHGGLGSGEEDCRATSARGQCPEDQNHQWPQARHHWTSAHGGESRNHHQGLSSSLQEFWNPTIMVSLPSPMRRKLGRRLPFMSGKIFYRERQRYVDGAEHPRFLLVAGHDLNLTVSGQHFRLSELTPSAGAPGAEFLALPRGARNGRGELQGGKKRRKEMEARPK